MSILTYLKRLVKPQSRPPRTSDLQFYRNLQWAAVGLEMGGA